MFLKKREKKKISEKVHEAEKKTVFQNIFLRSVINLPTSFLSFYVPIVFVSSCLFHVAPIFHGFLLLLNETRSKLSNSFVIQSKGMATFARNPVHKFTKKGRNGKERKRKLLLIIFLLFTKINRK